MRHILNMLLHDTACYRYYAARKIKYSFYPIVCSVFSCLHRSDVNFKAVFSDKQRVYVYYVLRKHMRALVGIGCLHLFGVL